MALPVMSDAHRGAMRDRLLLAAAAVIADRGYDGMTIRDVLAQAGVAPSTLYAYFKGKAELVQALIERTLSMYVGELSQSGEIRVEDLFARMVRRAMSAPMELSTILAELRGRTATADAARRINQMIVKTNAPIVEQMRTSGAMTVRDPEAMVELLDILQAGMIQRASTDSFATSFERVGAASLELLAAVTKDPHAFADKPRRPAASRTRAARD